LNTTKEDLKERITEIDKYYQEQIEEMKDTIEAVKIIAKE
jgi:hypothetical protein